MDNLLNVRQAAFILKVHPLTIRRYIREQKLKAVRVGGNIRIKESDLSQFHKEYTPSQADELLKIRRKLHPVSSFTNEDPFFRLYARGASLALTEK